jgi:hypothetical protein
MGAHLVVVEAPCLDRSSGLIDRLEPARVQALRAKYGGMEVSDAKKLRALEDENRRLKHSYRPGSASTSRFTRTNDVVAIDRAKQNYVASTTGSPSRAFPGAPMAAKTPT